MSPGQVKEDNSFIWKGMVLASFIMLSMLTWASSPLGKIFEKIERKKEVIATMRVCGEIKSNIKVYEEYFSKMFLSGCMWERKNVLLMIASDDKEREEIKKSYVRDGSQQWEDAYNHCSPASTDYLQDGELKDAVLAPLYFNVLKCDEIEKEADKLGIKPEEYQDERR